MKKIILGALLVATPMLSMAKDYGSAGCGVGSIIFEGQSGLGPHVLAATTNGFYGTQTFAMTSGTLGCDVNGTITSHTAMYIDGNMENIASDMARGQGDALLALAALMGVQKEDNATFAAVTQANFASIFSSENTTSTDVMSSLVAVLKEDATLAKYVS
jgi:hypothetical protein